MNNIAKQGDLLPALSTDLIDDTPEKVSADLRKFNRAQVEVDKALTPLKRILVITDAAGVDSAVEHMKKAKSVETLIENKRKDLVRPWNNEVDRINAHAKGLVKEVTPEINRVKDLVLQFQKKEEVRLRDLRTQARCKQLVDMGLVHHPAGTGKILIPHYHDPQGECMVYFTDVESATDSSWPHILQNITNNRQAARDLQLKQAEQKLEGAAFFGETDETASIQEEIQELKAAPLPAAAPSFTPSFGSAKLKGSAKVWAFEITDASKVPDAYKTIDEVKIRKAIAAGERTIEGIRIFQKDSFSLR